MDQVIFGVDPHKLSATIEVVDHDEQLLGAASHQPFAHLDRHHMIHIAVVTQIRLDTEGRGYCRRKRSDGKRPMEAMRCFKRRISDVVYRQLAADAQRNALGEAAEGAGAGRRRISWISGRRLLVA